MHFSDSKQILEQINSVGFGDYKESPNEKQIHKIFISEILSFRKKTEISIKFSKICIFFSMSRRNFKQTFL